ncbi:calcium-binding protein, partial [Ectopseudomonas khazarica]|uniref:calcium-binding protein n=1 Tax=Ectopseudomonas khazarica TaxID=2502979 RepID=UPI0038514297
KNIFSAGSTTGIYGNSMVERLEFADGSSKTWAQIAEAGIVQIGSEGDDTMTGYSGIDEMHGGAGKDVIDGGTGTNRLYGGAGNDTLTVNSRSTDNLFVGGTGNDTLHGSYYSDTYLFNLGDGVDTIYETANGYAHTDVLRFGEGIKPEDIQALRVGNDLVYAHVNGTDKVIIKNIFSAGATTGIYGNSMVERLEFADGSSKTWAQIAEAGIVQIGSEGDDTMTGYSGIDEMHGGAGKDVIDGGTGTNRLYGGAGNDTLTVNSRSTDNLFVGGTGNDTLHGSYYSDTYLFNLGDGVDTIVETANGYAHTDVLRFGEGIKPEDIQALRVGNDLVYAHVNGTDKVIIKNIFSAGSTTGIYSNAMVERLEFADGSSKTWAQIAEAGIVQIGSEGNDTMTGYSGIDEMHGGAGDDSIDGGTGTNRLYGGAGDDTLTVNSRSTDNLFVGGTGNDTLHGSYYSDTYLFNLGDGVDTIVETANGYAHTDMLRFGEGIEAGQIWLGREGNNLQLQLLGTDDQVSIKNWYSSTSSQIEEFQLNDGRALSSSQVNNLVNAMAAFGSPAGGELDLSAAQREQLDMVIAANWQ